jgi:hypothetical protein
MSITRLTTNGLTGTKYDTVSADNYYMEPIATNLVGSGGVASVTFSNIPQGYKHLQIRFIGRDNRTSNPLDAMTMRFNSDSGSNYYTHYLRGDGATASAGGYSGTGIDVYRLTGPTASASMFGAGIIDILDYANVYKYKTTRTLGGADLNGSGEIHLDSGLWLNTSGISTVVLIPSNATLFDQYSRFSLYGIKG